MFKVKPLLIALILFLLSFLLRFDLIGKEAYNHDNLFMARQSALTVSTGHLHMLHSHGHPLVAMISALFIYLSKLCQLSDPVFAVNFMSVLFSSLCIPLSYFVFKKLLEDRSAFIGALLFSLSPVNIGNSVYGNTHFFSIFFLFIGLIYLFRYKESTHLIDLILSGIFFGACGASRLQDLAIFFLPLTFLFFINVHNIQNIKNDHKIFMSKKSHFIILILIMSLVVMLFYLPAIFKHQHSSISNQWIGVLQHYFLDRFHTLFGYHFKLSSYYLLQNFSFLGILIILLGMSKLFLQQKKICLFLCLWAVLPYLIFGQMNNVHPRYLLLTILPLSFVQGYFFSQLRNKRLIFQSLAIFLCVAISILPLLNFYPAVKFRNTNSLVADHARWIGKHTEPNALIISGNEMRFINHYAHRNIFPRPYFSYHFKQKEFLKFKNRLNETLDKGIPVYITTKGLLTFDPQQQFSNAMLNNYFLTYAGETLSEYWPGVLSQRIVVEKLYKISKVTFQNIP